MCFESICCSWNELAEALGATKTTFQGFYKCLLEEALSELDLILYTQVSVSLRDHLSHAAYMATGLRAHQVLCCALSHEEAKEPSNA